MAEITFTLATFPGVEALVTYEDVTYGVTSIQVLNYSQKNVECTLKRLVNPKRIYNHVWGPGDTTSFDVPNGIDFTFNDVDGNLTMPDIELYVRYG